MSSPIEVYKKHFVMTGFTKNMGSLKKKAFKYAITRNNISSEDADKLIAD